MLFVNVPTRQFKRPRAELPITGNNHHRVSFGIKLRNIAIHGPWDCQPE